FRAPQPAEQWRGVRECDAYGAALFQEKYLTLTTPLKLQPMSEDCLTLNVFSPDSVPSAPRPVMVFIHGGGFLMGMAATPIYDGTHLARSQDVVVVTIQYRFGPFGFLDLTDYATVDRPFETNLGLRDQIAALDWVRRNIAAFGGDPGNVTVFGESAGGTSVVALLASPAAKGLFAGAIAESPAPELVVEKDTARTIAAEFLRLLDDPARLPGAPHDGRPFHVEQARRLLSRASGRAIHETGKKLMDYAQKVDVGVFLPLAPIVGDDILPQSPLQAARAGATHPIPLIIGNNREEGALFSRFFDLTPAVEKTVRNLAGTEGGDAIRAVYTTAKGDKSRLSGDFLFWGPTSVFVDGHSAVAPTFHYRYDYVTRLLKASGFGATHTTEMLAVFGSLKTYVAGFLAIADWRSVSRLVGEVQGRWGGFARHRNPGRDWPAYTTTDRQVMIIDDPSRVDADPDAGRREVWQRLHSSPRDDQRAPKAGHPAG
ncbi:MAG: carboxylesterase/lipase family protein, partial [Gordonia amarae]